MISVEGNSVFSGTFTIACMDANCCTVTISSIDKELTMELQYNGNYPNFGRSRDCPPINVR